MVTLDYLFFVSLLQLFFCFRHQMERTIAHLQGIDVSEENIVGEIENFRLSRMQNVEQEKKDVSVTMALFWLSELVN